MYYTPCSKCKYLIIDLSNEGNYGPCFKCHIKKDILSDEEISKILQHKVTEELNKITADINECTVKINNLQVWLCVTYNSGKV